MGRKVTYTCDECGENIDVEKENPYLYKKNYYHGDCLKNKLKKSKRPKYSPEEINKIYETAERHIKRKAIKKATKGVTIPTIDTKNFKLNQEHRKKLVESIESRYKVSIRLEPTIARTIDALNDGKYKKLDGHKVPYELLYKMFYYYDKDLTYAHSKVKKQFANNTAMFLYDIAILANKVEEFQYMLKQGENETVVTELENLNVDASGYLQGRRTDDSDNDDDIDLSAFLEGYE